MVLEIIIVIIALIGLLVIHELGHFLTAKKLGVKVEEFGIGYPPRIFGRKFGETIYSINLLPFGAFVRIQGEEEKVEGERSFSERPILHRSAIILGGVVTFWIVAFLIFTVVAGVWGLPQAVGDDFPGKAQVQIIQVAKNSPAQLAGLKAGDVIENFGKVKALQDFTKENTGKEITLTVKRGKETLNVSLVPREAPPENQGAMGVALARVARFKYPFYQAPLIGAKATGVRTVQIPIVLGTILRRALQGEKVEGVELVGPIGIGDLMSQSLRSGVDNFLLFLAMIALWLALVNILPIPALDGGKFLFLIIEAVRKKPVSQAIEQKLTAVFFLALILLMALVTVKDIMRFF